MKNLLFVGGYDKLDLLIYIGSILNETGKNVLVVDISSVDRARYIIPSIYHMELPKRYITKYLGVDVAVGYTKYSELEEDNVFNLKKVNEFSDTTKLKEYDIIIYNIDSNETLKNFPIKEDDMIFVVTSFDIYSLEKAIRAFKDFDFPNKVYKVIFTKKLTAEQLEYFSYLFKEVKVNWEEYPIIFLLENGDQSAIYDNQRLNKISLKNFSSQFKSSLQMICQMIDDNNLIPKYISKLERR